MVEKEWQVADRLKRLLPRLSAQDKAVFLAYGEGMACKAARIMTQDSAADQQRQK